MKKKKCYKRHEIHPHNVSDLLGAFLKYVVYPLNIFSKLQTSYPFGFIYIYICMVMISVWYKDNNMSLSPFMCCCCVFVCVCEEFGLRIDFEVPIDYKIAIRFDSNSAIFYQTICVEYNKWICSLSSGVLIL